MKIIQNIQRSIIVFFVFSLSIADSFAQNFISNSEEEFLFIGTYTRNEGWVDGKGKGIYVYGMNRKTGLLRYISTSPKIENPTYLVIHPNKQWVYSVEETSGTDSIPFGSVSAFRFDSTSGQLELMNTVSSEGNGPCYISIDNTNKFILVANYGSGNVAMLPILADGKLGKATSAHQHTGRGPTSRQEGPHAHIIIPSHNNQTAYSVDLGTDGIYSYSMDTQKGELTLKGPETKVTPGAGPRHLAFHPNQIWAYVVAELNGTIVAFSVDTVTGALTNFQIISTVEDGNTGTPASADIHIHPNGKFLYASNRGEVNDIALFTIDQTNGKLSHIANQTVFGKTPRNFVIDPTGNFLLVANQDSGNVVTFRIDLESGKLIETGMVTEIPTPVCLKFY